MPKGDIERLKADPLDGTTPVANLLLMALANAKLSGRQKGAIAFLWRRTYGWCIDGVRPKEARITLPLWAKALDTDPSMASKIVTSLVKHNVIIQKSLGQGKGYLYQMNTDVESWNGGCINKQLLHEMTTLAKNDMTTLVKNDNTTLVKNDNTTLVKNDNPIMLGKERIKEILKERLKETPPEENRVSKVIRLSNK